MARRITMSRFTAVLAAGAVLAVVAALVLVLVPGQDKKYVTASFPRTISLYEGSDVRILGVPVGEVESVTPAGTDVTVRMWYDAKYDVPADAKAVIISPAIVGDRFVQLTPVYRQGPKLPAHATLTERQTSTPLELDEIYQSIDDLTVALGPQGANSEGALTRLLDSTAKNFAGQGEQFNQTIKDLGRLTGTLDNNKEELFGTVRQMERFVHALAENDKVVRRFNQSLASAADMLEGERDDLAAALRNLGVAMREVTSFVRENRDKLSENIEGLNVISQVLVKQRDALAETLNTAPLALNNLYLTYNPQTGTLDTRANLGENLAQLGNDPAVFLCSLLNQADASKKACGLVQQVLKGVNRVAALDGAHDDATPVEVERVEATLAGLVEVPR